MLKIREKILQYWQEFLTVYHQILITFYTSSKFLAQNSSDYTPLSKMSNQLIQYSRKLPTVVNYMHTLSTN